MLKKAGKFSDSNELGYLDLFKINTSNVTYMSLVNEYLKLLEISIIDNFNTFNITNIKATVQFCRVLEYLDLSNFNTFNVKSMEGMFNKCYKLREIMEINNFNINDNLI